MNDLHQNPEDEWFYNINQAKGDYTAENVARLKKKTDEALAKHDQQLIESVLEDVKNFLAEDYYIKSKDQIEAVKPTHGPCCTCQKCGREHDECVCESNRLNAGLDRIKANYLKGKS